MLVRRVVQAKGEPSVLQHVPGLPGLTSQAQSSATADRGAAASLQTHSWLASTGSRPLCSRHASPTTGLARAR